MAEDIRNTEMTKGIREFETQYELPDCIVLDSAYCSMGRMIGYQACQLSGYTYYDAVILLELVPECGISIDDVMKYEQKLRRSEIRKEDILNDPEYQKIHDVFDKAADIALAKGRCLIHDRVTKEEVLAKGYSCVSAMTYSTDMDAKLVKAKVSPLYRDLTDELVIQEKIKEEDNIRMNWHQAASDTIWGDKDTYDIVINTDAFGKDYSAVILSKVMRK